MIKILMTRNKFSSFIIFTHINWIGTVNAFLINNKPPIVKIDLQACYHYLCVLTENTKGIYILYKINLFILNKIFLVFRGGGYLKRTQYMHQMHVW